MPVDDLLGTIAVLLGAGLLARVVAELARVPELVLLLAAGVLVGPDVLDWAEAPLESPGTQVLLTLGVAFILFHGGLGLSAAVLSRTAVGLGLLVVPGVLLTALVAGAAAALAFDIPLLHGLLIGAVLAPTDPAILIPLFDRVRVRAKVAQTIVAESALNDPTGAVLALALAAAVAGGHAGVREPLVEFVGDVGVSVAIGLGFGVLLSALVSDRRFGVWRESAEVAVAVVLMASFVSIDFAGGSGYLGAFLAGFVVANMRLLRLGMRPHHDESVRSLAAQVADLVVLLVFVVLGANLPWEALRANWLPGLAVVLALVILARPLTVAACLVPDRRGRWTRRELLFMAWTRETGVVPAALAGVLVALDVPNADLVTVCVALALVVTVVLQATTKPWLVRRLDLLEPGDAKAAS